MEEVTKATVVLPNGETKSLEEMIMNSFFGPNGEKPTKVTILGLERGKDARES